MEGGATNFSFVGNFLSFFQIDFNFIDVAFCDPVHYVNTKHGLYINFRDILPEIWVMPWKMQFLVFLKLKFVVYLASYFSQDFQKLFAVNKREM